MSEYFLYPNKPIRVMSMDSLYSAIRGRESDWVLQSKHDGDRAIITVDENITIYSRHKNVLADASPWTHIRKLPLKAPYTLDAELVNPKLLIVWDYGYEHGRLVAATPYESRLERVCALPNLSSIEGYTIRPVSSLPVTERNAAKLLKGDRVEGLVAKRVSARDLWGITSTKETPSQVKWRV